MSVLVILSLSEAAELYDARTATDRLASVVQYTVSRPGVRPDFRAASVSNSRDIRMTAGSGRQLTVGATVKANNIVCTCVILAAGCGFCCC